MLEKLLQMLKTLAAEMNYDSIGDLLDAVVEEQEERSDLRPWPPPFEVTLDKVGEDNGMPILAMVLHNIDRDITSFKVDVADFDAEGDGPVKLIDFKLGEKLKELAWFSGYRLDIGRIGGYSSRIREYEDIKDELESLVLCYLTIDRDDEFTLKDISIGCNYEKVKGEGDTHATYNAFTDATYQPDESE